MEHAKQYCDPQERLGTRLEDRERVTVVVGGWLELFRDAIESRSSARLPSCPTSWKPPVWIRDGEL